MDSLFLSGSKNNNLYHLPILVSAQLPLSSADNLCEQLYRKQTVGPDLGPNRLTPDSVPERIFVKKLILNAISQQTTKKHEKSLQINDRKRYFCLLS